MHPFELIRTELKRLVVQEIGEVFYAPHRAFNKIVKNPKFIAPIIVIIIFLVLQVASSYVVGTRSYLEQTAPTSQEGDVWTENAALWQANQGASVTANHVDYINSSNSYYNTTSIEFTAQNASSLQIFLNDFGQIVNCGPDGFRNLSIRVKTVTPASTPNNVTLYLLSVSPANYFAYDLTSAFSNTTIAEQHLWNNLTVQVGEGNGVASNSAASWNSITGLRMDFTWSSIENVDVRVDGIFFRGVYKGLLDIDAGSLLTNAALSGATPFLFEWLVLTALMYLLIKGLKGNVIWKPVMVAVGVAMVVLVVQTIILIVTYASVLPAIRYPLELIAGVPGENQTALLALQDTLAPVYQIGGYVQIVIWAWIFGLGVFIVRAVTALPPAPKMNLIDAEPATPVSYPQFSWAKSMVVSIASLALTIIILWFLGIA
jgi:hypothetical protein